MKGFNRARNAAAGQPAAENTGSGFWNSDADNKKLSENNLRQIGLALHNYHDVFQTFPAGAVVREGDNAATNSWAICALPFLSIASIGVDGFGIARTRISHRLQFRHINEIGTTV